MATTYRKRKVLSGAELGAPYSRVLWDSLPLALRLLPGPNERPPPGKNVVCGVFTDFYRSHRELEWGWAGGMSMDPSHYRGQNAIAVYAREPAGILIFATRHLGPLFRRAEGTAGVRHGSQALTWRWGPSGSFRANVSPRMDKESC